MAEKNHDLATKKSPSIFFQKIRFFIGNSIRATQNAIVHPYNPWVPENGACQVGNFFRNLPRFGHFNERSSVDPTVPVRARGRL